MQWTDNGSFIEILSPEEFSFTECLVFLRRSDQEILHHIQEQKLMKLVKVNDELVLLKISSKNNRVIIEFPFGEPSRKSKEKAVQYISEWFDLEKDLSAFYQMSSQDSILQSLAVKHYGLRMIGIPDLFEAVTWAIMGQQINLKFAYTLKKRFVEHFGEKLDYEGRSYWLYPSPEMIANIEVEDLKKLQFTSRKAEYVIGTAKVMASGELSKGHLMDMPNPDKQHQSLVSIKGIGAWTADYVLMKCLLEPTAFPIADVGLHNAIKNQLGLDVKPKIDEIKELARKWSGWEAYAAFYLWRSLYG